MGKPPKREYTDAMKRASRKWYYKTREARLAYWKSPERVAARLKRTRAASAAAGKVARLPIPEHERNTKWRALLNSAKARAKVRGFEFNLTSEWAFLNYTGYCSITGVPFVPNFSKEMGNHGPSPFSASIDRIDNSKGYVAGNCRFVLFAVNTMKNTMSDRQVYEIAQRIVAVLGPAMGHAMNSNETVVSGFPIASIVDDLRLLQRARTL